MGIPMKIVSLPGYSAPQIKNLSVYRCNATGNADDSGTYFKISAERKYCSTGEFSDNRCQIRYCYRQLPSGSYSEWTTILDANNLETNRVTTGPLVGTLSADESYEVIVGVADTVGSELHTSAVVASSGAFLHKDGEMNSIAIGEVVNERNTVSVAEKLSVKVKGSMSAKRISCEEGVSAGKSLSGGGFSFNNNIMSVTTDNASLITNISDGLNQNRMSNNVGAIHQYIADDRTWIELRNYIDKTVMEIILRAGAVRITGLTAPLVASDATNKAYVDNAIAALDAEMDDNTYNYTYINCSAVASNTGSPISGMPYYAILHPDYSVFTKTPIATSLIMLGNDGTQSGGATPTTSVMLGSMTRSGSIISQILAFSTGYQTVRATIGVWYKRNG